MLENGERGDVVNIVVVIMDGRMNKVLLLFNVIVFLLRVNINVLWLIVISI